LREALARIDNDFVYSEPEPKKRSRVRDMPPPPVGFFTRLRRTAQFAARHANLFVGLLFLALIGTVMANALLWQKSRHPAPLFARKETVPAETHTAPQPVPVPVPAARPEPAQLTPAPVAPAPVPVPTPAPAVEHPAPYQPPHGRDPMAEAARLPQPGKAPTATRAPAPAAAPTNQAAPHTARDPIAQLLKTSVPAESSRTIYDAQRALQKLGYVVKTDGVMTPATRDALKQFERDRKLPVHGNLSTKVLHELSSESGVTIR